MSLTLRGVIAAMLAAASCGVPARAQSTDWGRVHEVTVRGIDLLYNLEMERAGATFDSVTALAPTDPRGRFFRSMVHFWIYTLRNQETDFEQFMAVSDTVVSLCEGLVDRDPRDAVAMFYLGGIRGYRGLALQLRGSILKAVMEGREGYLQLEEAVRVRPDLADAQMGFGLYRYLVAKIPSAYAWVVKLLGFEGDLEGGLQSLRIAATTGVYTRSEASFFLSQFLQNEHRHEESFDLMRSLIARHPDNTLFLVLYASWQFRRNNYDEALSALDRAAGVNARKSIRYGEEFIHSTRASIAYTRNDFATARREYDLFMQKNQLPERVPSFTFYRIAVARDIMRDRAGAIEACRKVKEVRDRDRAWESYISRKAQELAERPLTQAEILAIRGANTLSRNEPDSALIHFRASLAAAGEDPDQKARALYGLQQAFEQKRLDSDVLRTGEEVVSLKPDRETWLIPHAYVKMAQAEARRSRKPEALRLLEAAEEFDDYDFQENLESRMESQRDSLQNNR